MEDDVDVDDDDLMMMTLMILMTMMKCVVCGGQEGVHCAMTR
jgi:hypothetical protein